MPSLMARFGPNLIGHAAESCILLVGNKLWAGFDAEICSIAKLRDEVTKTIFRRRDYI